MIPLHQQRTNLGADEMIRATGAEIGEPRSRMRVNKVQHFGDIREVADHALLGRDATAQEGHQLVGNLLPFPVWSVPHAAKGLAVSPRAMALDELADLVDDGDGVEIRCTLGVSPGEKAVAAEYDSIATWHCLHRALQHHGEFEARTLPRDPHHLVAELVIELIHLFLTVCRGSQRDSPVRMKMVDVREGEKGMQRGVDGSRDGIVAEGAERIHADHLVFQFHAPINPGQRQHLVQIEGGKAFDLDAAQVATAALNPQHGLLLSVQWIGFIQLRAGVSTPEVGDAQVRSQEVGTVAQEGWRIESPGVALIPKIGEILQRHAASPDGR